MVRRMLTVPGSGRVDDFRVIVELVLTQTAVCRADGGDQFTRQQLEPRAFWTCSHCAAKQSVRFEALVISQHRSRR